MKVDDTFQHFLDEGLEALHDCEDVIAESGDGQENGDRIDFLFRNYHSIKGSAGMLGLHSLEKMAHSIEDLLSKVRQGDIHLDADLKGLVLQGNDALEELIVRACRDKADPNLLPEEAELIRCISFLGNRECSLESLLGSFVKDIKEIVSDKGNREIESELCQKIISSIERLDQDYQGLARPKQGRKSTKTAYDTGRWVFGHKDAAELAKSIGKFFQDENEHQPGDPGKLKEIVSQIDELDKIAEQGQDSKLSSLIKGFKEDFTAVITSPVGLDKTLFMLFKDHWWEILNQTGFHPNSYEPKQAADIEAKPGRDQSEKGQKNTLRIPENRLDKFLTQVAELIIMAEHSSNFVNRMEMVTDLSQLQSLVKDLDLHTSNMSKTMLNLESSLQDIRKIKAKNITRKAQRQIRELAKKMGKKVFLEIQGDDIEADKNIIEKLDNPLMHILRNCLDHGLESPGERVKCGKSETGRIRISVKEEEKTFLLIVSDDGRGIDLEGVKSKAIANGLLSQGQLEKMDSSEISQLIFQAGLSTAKEVTTISGRGVGMEIVKKNAEALKGSIAVSTESFKGTTITISIPLRDSLMVTKGVLFRVGSSKFIIEAENMIEILSLDKVQIFTIQGWQKMITVRNTAYPLIDFDGTLGQGRATTKLTGTMVIFVLEAKRGQVCLSADEVLGMQSFVVKEMNGPMNDINLYKGTAILKDGSIGLVLDVDSVVDEYDVHGCK